MSFAFEMPSVRLAFSYKKYIFSKHQPQVSTNIGKANVTKHKKVVQNFL